MLLVGAMVSISLLTSTSRGLHYVKNGSMVKSRKTLLLNLRNIKMSGKGLLSFAEPFAPEKTDGERAGKHSLSIHFIADTWK